MIILFLTSLIIVSLQVYTFKLFPSFWLIFKYLNLSPITLTANHLFFINFCFLFLFAYLLFKKFLPKDVKKIHQILLFSLFFVSPWTLQLISGSPLYAITQRFETNLDPAQYGFYTDVHRQADLVAGYPMLGKIYYNKYIVVGRHIWQNATSLLDWDRYVFISSSGKAPLDSRFFPQLTLFELPILIFGLYLLFRSKNFLLIGFVLGSTLLTSIIKQPGDPIAYQEDPGWLVWFFLTLVVIISIPKVIPRKFLLPAVLLILLTRLANVNASFTDNTAPKKSYEAYQKVSQILAELPKDQKVVITDRLGQPHVYLTYFGLISRSDYLSSLNQKIATDKFGLKQPPRINNFEFSSFTFGEGEMFELYPNAYWIELKENFNQVDENPSVVKVIDADPFLVVQTQ